ncbi:ribonuclease P protein subunit p30 isoform X2 [Bufo gargarizans]|uniref:ribonuclease P protein subunit p30 isoform X2 n=1 Tax=Bufo gargarizans TaxID=30331 RepID=UPI001CF3499B|nr:ribonuclease P protein subunit p30 isoform X2 [Bufo gargarizans]
MAVFVDLNLTNCTTVKKLQSVIEMAAHLGYSAVAINHIAEFEKKKPEIVKPISTKDLFASPPTVQGKSTPIQILKRLTVIASDPSHFNVLRSTSPVTRLYDIVAVYPKTEKLFHAIERGIFFELIYTPAIKDSTLRRYTISNALSLMEICKGKNIIISSGAEKPLELRGPYDVATLGLLFGLSERSAKAALSTNCRAALLHGETRKTAFGITHTVKKPQTLEDEGEAAEPASKKAKKE